ncbi:universal stress protein [Pseudoduganella namucuonensis]|uniref:Nucleotide-binding universal stress protein, UspA family n=1 Tax=Pseudoduganella namucuonensis TaxID=1035707 RepID=A0A1I7KP66_9BURK|nr:universal stress protein [Pseudoduganella namucuonensis]SFU99209.1 Nucleotide-binding universal stress protein, UspA family [Pseudoduganella namucuonensis]
MSYRTILVHADTSRHAKDRIAFAATLARTYDAHLVGAALTGVSRFLPPVAIEQGGQLVAEQIALMRQAADDALALFEQQAAGLGVDSREGRLVNDDLDGGMALQARYADLTIVSQTDPDDPALGAWRDLPEYVLLNAARPLLVLPYAGRHEHVGSHVLVAWDGSMEATRALACALPLLRDAALVSVVVFNPGEGDGVHGEQPGADIAMYLSRHGVRVEVCAQLTGIDVGNALLSLAADTGADLLVMGGYGHARYRELLLGGVTRTILRSMTLPVLMAH